ncbi:hypothetical protein J6590_049938 [Homalodisca vitripennis]|nr:hypothetical protein J6590_049938 [Homalodisca vitripennis]
MDAVSKTSGYSRKNVEDYSNLQEILAEIEAMTRDNFLQTQANEVMERYLRKKNPNLLIGLDRPMMEHPAFRDVYMSRSLSTTASLDSSTLTLTRTSTSSSPVLTSRSALHSSMATNRINIIYRIEMVEREMEEGKMTMDKLKKRFHSAKFLLQTEEENFCSQLDTLQESKKNFGNFINEGTDKKTGRVFQDKFLRAVLNLAGPGKDIWPNSITTSRHSAPVNSQTWGRLARAPTRERALFCPASTTVIVLTSCSDWDAGLSAVNNSFEDDVFRERAPIEGPRSEEDEAKDKDLSDRQKLELRERLHPVDLDKLQIENQELLQVLDFKTRDLLDLKRTVAQRRELQEVVGKRLEPENLTDTIMSLETNWKAISSFAAIVMKKIERRRLTLMNSSDIVAIPIFKAPFENPSGPGAFPSPIPLYVDHSLHIITGGTSSPSGITSITRRKGQNLVSLKSKLNDTILSLKNMSQDIKLKEAKYTFTENKEAQNLNDLVTAEVLNQSIKKLNSTFKSPDVHSYLKMEMNLNELRMEQQVWERRCRNQRQTIILLEHQLKQTTPVSYSRSRSTFRTTRSFSSKSADSTLRQKDKMNFPHATPTTPMLL